MKAAPDDCLEIFLQPGEYYFGDGITRIRTLLGSCVALTAWHPRLRIGGMCHCLLPVRGNEMEGDLDGRYVAEAVLRMLRDAIGYDSNPAEFEYKLFGGGHMFPSQRSGIGHIVGARNVQYMRGVLLELGLRVAAAHTGGHGHRNVVLDLWSGDVWLRYQKIRKEPIGLVVGA